MDAMISDLGRHDTRVQVTSHERRGGLKVFPCGASRSALSTAVPLCRSWPYEHLSPTQLKEKKLPAKWPKGHKRDREAAQRQVEIAKNMEMMPKWIAEAKVCMTPSRAGRHHLTSTK
jgi:hypothetical protein